MHVLVINCGSATLKVKLFEATGPELRVVAGQTVEITGPYLTAVDQALAILPVRPDVIAHRVVHGGGRLPELARIDARVLGILRELSPLAPMHNGPALEGVEATLGAGVPLIAALETAPSTRLCHPGPGATRCPTSLASGGTGSTAGPTGS